MPTPRKPLSLLEGHRTKEEKETQAKAESALMTGKEMQIWPEVKAMPIANKRFAEIKSLLHEIGKDDALFEPVINRYCLIQAETYQLEQSRRRISASIRDLEKERKKNTVDFMAYMDLLTKLNGQLFSCDKLMTTKRKMLFDIERDNLMTLCSALRSIPKKAEEKKKSKMAAFLEKSGS